MTVIRKKGHKDMYNQTSELLTVEEVMDILKIGKNFTYRLLDSGALKGFKLGKTWKIPSECLNEFIHQKVS